jgi:signal transduction histidine kinase
VSRTSERLRILLPAGAVLLALALLTLLLIGSRGSDRALFDRLQSSLQAYELHDAELTRDALLARAGLLPNYDPLAADRAAMRAALAELKRVAGGADPQIAAVLQRPLADLESAQQQKLIAIEQFKSANALLRNSLLYYAYVGPSLRVPLQQQGLASQLGRLSYAVLSFLQSPNATLEQDILELLAGLESATGGGADLGSLIAHGRLLVRVLPLVDQQLEIIHTAPVATSVRALRSAAMERDAAQEKLARRSRYAMYLTSLCLLGSLAWLAVQMRERARELRATRLGLQRQRLRLVEANKLATLGLHLEGVAHDLRSPLQSVRSGADQLARFWPELENALDGVAARDPTLTIDGIPWLQLRPVLESLPADLTAQSAALADLSQYLLDFGRPRASGGHVLFDVNLAINQALRLVRHSVQRRTKHFELSLAEHLPAVRGDPLALGQVLVNLLDNALEALPGPDHGVRIRSRAAAQGVAIEVEDDGRGIEPAHMARLFEPFFTTREGRGGTGLGLGNSRAMVESMGGTLELNSTLGVGTRATIWIPARTPADGAHDDRG